MTFAPDPEVGELQTATEKLIDQVAQLSGALVSIGEIQAEQIELAHAVKSVKEDVEENAVPKHEFRTAQAQTIAARQHLQTRIRIFAIGCSVFALCVSGVSAYIAYKVDHNQRVAVCQERNREAIAGSARSKEFFKPYVAEAQANPKSDPVLLALLNGVANAQPTLLKCG